MFLLTWYFKVVNNIRIFVAFPVMLKIFKFLNICKRGRKRVRFTPRPLKQCREVGAIFLDSRPKTSSKERPSRFFGRNKVRNVPRTSHRSAKIASKNLCWKIPTFLGKAYFLKIPAQIKLACKFQFVVQNSFILCVLQARIRKNLFMFYFYKIKLTILKNISLPEKVPYFWGKIVSWNLT